MEFAPLPDSTNVHVWNARPGFYTSYAQEADGFATQSPEARLARQYYNSGAGRFLLRSSGSVTPDEQPRDEPPAPTAA